MCLQHLALYRFSKRMIFLPEFANNINNTEIVCNIVAALSNSPDTVRVCDVTERSFTQCDNVMENFFI